MKGRFHPLWLLILLVPCLWFVLPHGSPSIRRVNRPDPELQAAIDQAQHELPNFIKRFAANEPGTRFAIRGRFQSDQGPEYLWVRLDEIVTDSFKGRLDQAPLAVRTLHKGDSVTVQKADVVDWLIGHGAQTEGGFTEKALAR